ncbi:hypothetical protein D3C81_348330 [compost metagenome]|uniref:Putative lipoprotein n=1 Tax=Pseudomonas wadenswilerensis TaxID=1785161 RepID=A0A380SXZ4_9PSED|nr:hypothetical protein [Pseudomonas wadenswilerensis]SUQ62862.1 putative lipoprotein [Pseudomonas wadenswilerensis]
MDARFSLSLALPLALAACSTPPKLQPPAKHPGLEVFEKVIDEPAAPDSIIRQGDQITYMIAPSASNPWVARFDASCSQPSGSMFYPTKRGMQAFSDNDDSSNLPQPQLQVLQRSEQLKNACAYRAVPDWRALDTAPVQDWLVLDRNSAIHEDGVLKIWTSIQLANYQAVKGYGQIAQLHERLAIDCKQRTFKPLSDFKVDDNGRVYNGKVNLDTPMMPQAQADSGQQRLIEAACQPAATWAQMAMPPVRTPLPPQLDTPKTAPAVLAAINTLQLPEPRLTLQALHYRYDALVLNGMKITGVQRKDIFSRDPQSGQLLLQPVDSVLGTKLLLTFRGLIELANRSFDRNNGNQVEDSLHVIGLSFTGDWQRLPEHSEVAYDLVQATTTGPFTTTVTCKVGAALPASQINPALQGMAKPLSCSKHKTATSEWTEGYHYLEDYGVFVQAAQNSPLGRWTWRVESVR